MVKEIERAGIPVVHICTVTPISMTVGANRIVPAVAIPHPLGNPALDQEEEKKLRRQIVEKALKALKDGTDPEEVASQYMVDSATYSGKETFITTKKTDISTRMINKLYKAKKAGVIDEIFTNESSGTTYAYVAVLVTNTYKDIKDEVYTTLSSDDDVKKACLVYYLKKYNFEVHDQDVFDNLKANNPEYLVSRPDLAKSKD